MPSPYGCSMSNALADKAEELVVSLDDFIEAAKRVVKADEVLRRTAKQPGTRRKMSQGKGAPVTEKNEP